MSDSNNEEKFAPAPDPKFGKKARPKTTGQIKSMEKSEQIHTLRIAGISWEQIAKKLGYASASGPYKLFQAYVKEVRIENGQELAKVEAERLDMAHRAMVGEMMNGKHKAAAALAIVKISESRRKLFGVDAPTRSEIEIHQSLSFLAHLTDEELDEIIAEGNNGENVLTYDDETHKIIDAKVVEDPPHGDNGNNGKQLKPPSGQSPPGDTE